MIEIINIFQFNKIITVVFLNRKLRSLEKQVSIDVSRGTNPMNESGFEVCSF